MINSPFKLNKEATGLPKRARSYGQNSNLGESQDPERAMDIPGNMNCFASQPDFGSVKERLFFFQKAGEIIQSFCFGQLSLQDIFSCSIIIL